MASGVAERAALASPVGHGRGRVDPQAVLHEALWLLASVEAAVVRAGTQQEEGTGDGEAVVAAQRLQAAMARLGHPHVRPGLPLVVRWRVGFLLARMAGTGGDRRRREDFVVVSRRHSVAEREARVCPRGP